MRPTSTLHRARRSALIASAALALSLLAAPGTASARPAGHPHHLHHPVRTFSVRGNGYPQRHRYRLALWRKDDVSNCRAHSYGHAVRAYFRRDPCRSETRYLYTLRVRGRAAVLEVEGVVTGILPHDRNGYRSATELIKLENSSGTGSVNDLLREGWSIPHARHIPRHEAFRVLAEDSGVEIFDAWYVHGRTPDHDRALRTMESQLYLTKATSLDF